MMSQTVRMLGATFVSVLVLALIESLPAVGGAVFWALLRFNAMISSVLFVTCGTLSHVILRWKRWTRLREYVGVMFAVATVVLLLVQVTLLQWIFGEGGSEYHSGTQVIQQGHFTAVGLALTLVEALFGALCLSAAFGLFWKFAVRPRSQSHE